MKEVDPARPGQWPKTDLPICRFLFEANMKKEDPEIKQAPLPKSRADLEYQITMLLNRDDISEGELPIPGRANKRILLLQNDKLAVKKLEKELNAAFQDEFKTESVYSIEQAIERIAHKRFDLLAVDKDMPGYKGLDVIDRLREANIETPIVILTGRQDKELAIKALNQGVDDYIVAGPDIAMIGRALLFSLERTRADRLQRASLKLDKLAIRDVLEHAPIMMIRIDEQYLIRDCNTSFATTTGRLIKDLKGRSIFEVVPGFQTAGIKEVLETGNTLQKRVRLTGLADRDDLDMTWNLVCWPVFRSLAGTKEALITGVDISHEAQL
ncbi:MAG: response regulator, partial [Candidatus Obscuribacterales bacterium]|nr:response regulator [Candidatus Obscuribacterales bacterium]